MSKENDQNNGVEVTIAEQLPQENKPKKEFCLIRAGKWVNRKYLQFKATPVGRWVVRGGKVTEGVLAVYGLKKFIDMCSADQEAIITCGEIADEPETESMDEEPAEEEVTEHE